MSLFLNLLRADQIRCLILPIVERDEREGVWVVFGAWARILGKADRGECCGSIGTRFAGS